VLVTDEEIAGSSSFERTKSARFDAVMHERNQRRAAEEDVTDEDEELWRNASRSFVRKTRVHVAAPTTIATGYTRAPGSLIF
jgi:hypothetical protein